VNNTIVEEVLQDLGVLDFGKGITADSNIAIWREGALTVPLPYRIYGPLTQSGDSAWLPTALIARLGR